MTPYEQPKQRRLGRYSPVWDKARSLLEQQEEHQCQLLIMMTSKPISGLYHDEEAQTTKDKFPLFVDHIRRSLARSPRTVLRQALHQAMVENRQASKEKDHAWKELIHLLQSTNLLPFPKPTSPAMQKECTKAISTSQPHVTRVAQEMESLSKGKCYNRWLQADARIKMMQPCPTTDEELRKEISKGLVTKMRKKRRDFNGEGDEEIKRYITNIQEKNTVRKLRLQETVNELYEKLQTDEEYQLYLRAQELWKSCGGTDLWSNYQDADMTVCRNRGRRGAQFEDSKSELCFAMIVSDLVKSKSTESELHPSEFVYERNVYWWHKNRKVGEIDLVILDSRRQNQTQVLAICEMKSSCFELAMAARQHEPKIKAAIRKHVDRDAVSAREAEMAGSWSIGKTFETSYTISSEFNSGIRLYLITNMGDPSESPSPSKCHLGVEPNLSNAICRGIRGQGLHIAHKSTLAHCVPLTQQLLLPKAKFSAHEVLRRLEIISEITFDEEEKTGYGFHTYNDAGSGGINYDELRLCIMSSLGCGHSDRQTPVAVLDESPLGTFKRFQRNKRLLVLPRR